MVVTGWFYGHEAMFGPVACRLGIAVGGVSVEADWELSEAIGKDSVAAINGGVGEGCFVGDGDSGG